MHWVYWIGYTISRLLAALYFRRRIIHGEKLGVEGGHLVVANHTSFLDPPMIGSCFPEAIHYLGRKTLFKGRLVGWVYRKMNTIPIDQDRPEVSTMKTIIRLAREGEKVLLFPEGERTLDGQLKEKGAPGVGLLIAKSKVPILPVRLFGAFEALPRGAKFPRPAKLTLVVGDPVDVSDVIENSGLTGRALYQALSDRAMDAIRALELPEEAE